MCINKKKRVGWLSLRKLSSSFFVENYYLNFLLILLKSPNYWVKIVPIRTRTLKTEWNDQDAANEGTSERSEG